ncbi:LysR family transcriptional regulator [Vibrio gallicus]|uniref:LysR family transcriptional regulator n=1 Tax=Vibrio gallicus TaxID=190897 RepID=UPI0021C3D615|nr:LysR family transcriptional regulator [Vibrio gallicus]
MDLNLFSTFLAVYRCRSITVAAEQLDLTQPAVSAAVKRLEASLNQTLFVREGRGIAPTGAAVSLATRIEDPLATLEVISESQRELKVYCNESMLHMVAQLDEMAYIESPLEEDKLYDDLITQKVDLIIDVLETKRQGLIVEHLTEEDVVCLTHKQHPLVEESMTLDSYFAQEHIALKIRRGEQNTIDYLSDNPLPSRRVKIETKSISSMLMLASTTDYVASSNRSLAEKWAPPLGLVIHEFPFPLRNLRYNMIFHRRYIKDPFHKKKREQIQRIFANI